MNHVDGTEIKTAETVTNIGAFDIYPPLEILELQRMVEEINKEPEPFAILTTT